MTTIDSFKFIGISTRTTNLNNQSAIDIGKLWERFYTDRLVNEIPNKLTSDIYSIYTDYNTNFTEDYTVLIGQPVSSLDIIPNGFIAREFPAENFIKFIAKGPMPKAIIDTWTTIWKRDQELNRKYSYDFELYSERSQNGDYSEVDIYIAAR